MMRKIVKIDRSAVSKNHLKNAVDRYIGTHPNKRETEQLCALLKKYKTN